MSKSLKIVSVRLKPDAKLYSNTVLATSDNVAFLMAKEVSEYKEDSIGILNLNAAGQVINLNVVDIVTFENDMQNVMAASILSNAASVILVSKDDSIEKQRITKMFSSNMIIAGIQVLDHICVSYGYDKEVASIKSYCKEAMIQHGVVPENVYVISGKNQIASNSEHLRIKTDKYIKSNREIDKSEAIDIIKNDISLMDREVLAILSLDEHDKPLNYTYNAIGDIVSCAVSPREIFKVPLMSNASSIIMFHNHPSGIVTPSEEDRASTQRIHILGQILGVKVEDHVIVGSITKDTYSFAKSHAFEQEHNIEPLKEVKEEKVNYKLKGETKIMKCIVNGRMAKPAKIELIPINGERVKMASFTIFTPDPNGPKKTVVDKSTGEEKTYNQGAALNCKAWGENADYIEKLKVGEIVTGAATVRYGKDAPSFVITRIDKGNSIHKQMNSLITSYTEGEIDKFDNIYSNSPSFQKDDMELGKSAEKSQEYDIQEMTSGREYGDD